MRRPTFALLGFSCLLVLSITPELDAQESQSERVLTLSEALDIAEKRSETVGIARAGVLRAEGQRQQARSAYFPQLSGSASYQRTLESQFSALSSGSDITHFPQLTIECGSEPCQISHHDLEFFRC